MRSFKSEAVKFSCAVVVIRPEEKNKYIQDLVHKIKQLTTKTNIE